MGNIRQTKKNRSSAPKQRMKRKGVLKSGKKKINVLGNAIIAENWYARCHSQARGNERLILL
jgi:nucleolar protein 16